MKKGNKLIAILLTLALILSMLAACSNKGNTEKNSNSPDSAGPSQQGTTEGKENASVGATSENTSVLRDVVNVAMSTDNGTWDPFNHTGGAGMWGVYQSLGYIIDGEFYPSLMKSYSFSDDMKTVYCELFDNISDSNGVHMTADDIVWSYEMANAGTTAGLGSICEGCYATGEYTFEFRLYDEMQVGRIDKMLKFFCVTRESYEASPDNMATTPVGTGPYKVTNITSGYSWTLERRDDYWQTDASVNCFRDNANVQTINYYVISESAQRAIALQNGTIDMVMELTAEDRESLANNKNYWFYAVPDDLSMDCVPNCDPSSPMGDINLRLAVFYAIDANAILQSVYNGNGTLNHTLAPDWAVGYNPEWAEVDSYYTKQDVELAKEYLAKSNYNGEVLQIMCQTMEAHTTTAQLVMAFLNNIGIKCEIKALETSVFREYKKNASEWDILINTDACNTYWVDAAYGQLSTDRTDWGSSQNFVWDDELEQMLRYTISMSNATPENFDTLNTYILEHAYFYSLVNYHSFMTVPSWCETVALSAKKNLVPGGCIYTE